MRVNKHLQDVFEFAKQTELDAKELYEREYEKTEDPGMRSILQMLIRAEQDHYEIFDEMQKEHRLPVKKISFSRIKNIFRKMKAAGKKVSIPDHPDFYKKVLDIEKKTEDFYRKEADASFDDEVKKTLNAIADEEHRHVILMENLLKFVRRPERWLEDAEFNQMDEY